MDVLCADNAIQSHIMSADWYRESNRICAYLSCATLREVSTSSIVEDLLQPGKSGTIFY
jgi:5-formyltetrahydrofolate cyclo-ligase